MNKTSRRSLARWAAGQLATGKSAGAIAKYLAAVLIENKMSDQADFLLDDILWELERTGDLAYARVTSVHPLSKQLEAALRVQIKKAAKADKIIVESKLDESAIAGLRIETASKVWDQTVARKLTELREAS